LEECMNSSLRMSASVLEGIPITPISDKVAEIIASAHEGIIGPRKYYYLIFRRFEQLRDRFDIHSYLDGYDLRKEIPGSKRTIQRICWSLQVLEPTLSSVFNPNIVLAKACHKGLIPLDVITSAFTVMYMINSDLYDKSEFDKSVNTVQNWYKNYLIPRTENEIAAHVEPDFLQHTKTAMDTNSSSNKLLEVIQEANLQDTPYKKWLLLWIVSHNSSLSVENQYDLWKSCLGKMVYRNTLRNLLRNSAFPLNRISRDEVLYDPHLLECYDKLTKH
jgi:hypothetical protein